MNQNNRRDIGKYDLVYANSKDTDQYLLCKCISASLFVKYIDDIIATDSVLALSVVAEW